MNWYYLCVIYVCDLRVWLYRAYSAMGWFMSCRWLQMASQYGFTAYVRDDYNGNEIGHQNWWSA